MRRFVTPIVLAAVLASTSARAQEPTVHGAAADATVDPSEPGPESVPGETATESAARPSGDPPPIIGRSLGDGGRVGIALLGGGAALAATTAAATSLIEAISRNDRDPNAPPKNPELVQVSGFVTGSLLSISVGIMLIGGALVVNDLAD